MRHHVRVHIVLVLAVVLLIFVLAPVAAAERAVVVAGAATGHSFGSSTGEVRIHFNSNVGGEVWVRSWFADRPDWSGTYLVTIDKDDYSAREGVFRALAIVVASDNPSFQLGSQTSFTACPSRKGSTCWQASGRPSSSTGATSRCACDAHGPGAVCGLPVWLRSGG